MDMCWEASDFTDFNRNLQHLVPLNIEHFTVNVCKTLFTGMFDSSSLHSEIQDNWIGCV